MSKPPRHGGGWCDPAQLPRGPNGRALCRQCNQEVPKGRRSFCSDPCVEIWKIRSSASYAAEKVLERDHGICALCGLDCVALMQELRQLREQSLIAKYGELGHRLKYMEWHNPTGFVDDDALAFVRRCRELELPRTYRLLNRRLWDLDHIIPVIDGGGSCGLDNLRTLCLKCHKQETDKLAARRAAEKRHAK